MEEQQTPPVFLRHQLLSAFFLVLMGLGSFSSFAQTNPAPFRRSLNMELDVMEGVTFYEIELRKKTPQGLKKPQFFKFKKALWKAELTPGSYEIRSRAYDDREVPGEWSESMAIDVAMPATDFIAPRAGEKFQTNDEKLEMQFKWKPVLDAEEYQVDLMAGGVTLSSLKTKKLETEIELNSGRAYQAQVRAIDPLGNSGDPSKPLSFLVVGEALKKVEMRAPIYDFKRKVLQFRWQADPRASEFIGEFGTISLQSITVAQAVAEFSCGDGDFVFKVAAQDPYFLLSPQNEQHVRVQRGKVVAYGSSHSDIENAKKIHPPRRVWGTISAVSANFHGENEDYDSFLNFDETQGFGLGLDLDWPKLIREFDFNTKFWADSYGALDSSGAQVDTYVFNFRFSLGQSRRFFEQSNWYWTYEGALIYAELSEFIGSPTSGKVGIQYFQSVNFSLLGRLGWMINPNWTLSGQIEFGTPVYWLQAVAKPKSAVLSRVEILVSRRLNSKWHSALGLTNFANDVRYPSTKSGTNRFFIEANYLLLKIGREF